ncbi:hypothetical protein I307_03768 [Cryptococcus deuterogattii 99/473]|uniref:Unplaced genomic scaffold supercont1.18, whole genome shotgun sequence n=1 Tax=Cryptococcus deuterogattii Ram5 TaxID=1296110 RepID=A0A0D0UUK7_9TREE|nr:hypothetical protein I313_06150 [Cryptococcus deuterogattii Ram5]KIY56669.1 hypothetical protein I307_03768 [Cryptococcus deuterogattii 99/473]
MTCKFMVSMKPIEMLSISWFKHAALWNKKIFGIYCLFAEFNKQNGQNASSAFCGIAADRKHLNYEIGRFKLGASSLVEAIPFMGAIGIFITSFLMYLRTCQSISAPFWLWKEMLGPLIWAVFFAYVSGGLLDCRWSAGDVEGDIAASSISPSRRAARKVKHWLKLRSLLSRDEQYEDGSWQSRGLAKVFPDASKGGDPYEWRYTDHFRKQLYGGGLLHLYKEGEV